MAKAAKRDDGRKVKAKTAKPTAGRSATRPDLLERIAALGVADKLILARAGVAGAFLSKARTGGGTGAQASASWAKVEAAVVAFERGRAPASSGPAAGPESFAAAELPPGVSLARALGAGSGGASAEGSADLREALVSQIQAARNAEQLQALARTVGELLVIGPPRGINPDVARVLNDNISRQQQLLKQKQEEDEMARAGEPVEIQIVYVDSWRERTAGDGTGGKKESVSE